MSKTLKYKDYTKKELNPYSSEAKVDDFQKEVPTTPTFCIVIFVIYYV